MGAWTWTHIKVSKINKEQGLKYCEYAENYIRNLWYFKTYDKNGYDAALDEYKKVKFKNKQYLIEECRVDESKFSNEYITNEFDKIINKHLITLDYICRYRNDIVSFSELVDKSYISNCEHCNIKLYNGEKYIAQRGEIFRLRQYDSLDLNLHTVEDLINYLRDNKRQSFICDFSIKNSPYEGLTDNLVKRIREHYGAIGDNNFIVNFG